MSSLTSPARKLNFSNFNLNSCESNFQPSRVKNKPLLRALTSKTDGHRQLAVYRIAPHSSPFPCKNSPEAAGMENANFQQSKLPGGDFPLAPDNHMQTSMKYSYVIYARSRLTPSEPKYNGGVLQVHCIHSGAKKKKFGFAAKFDSAAETTFCGFLSSCCCCCITFADFWGEGEKKCPVDVKE